jgi:hypothetical protein
MRPPFRFFGHHYGGSIYVGPYVIAFILKSDPEHGPWFGWNADWSRGRIWLACRGLTFGRWTPIE